MLCACLSPRQALHSHLSFIFRSSLREVRIMRISVRWTCLLAGALLALSACGSKQTHAPPPLNHDLLIGRWESEDADQFVQGYEFGPDQSVRVSIWRGPEIAATYSWTANTVLALEYHPSEDVKKRYKETLTAYRDDIKKRASKVAGQYGEGIAQSAAKYP